MLTRIFEGARIIDGLGSTPYLTDVATVDDRIVVIGDCSERDAIERVRGHGLALAPGFIDVHSHSDELWLADGRATGKIMQGVTTEIAGNCGTSAAPLIGYALERKVEAARRVGVEVDWQSFDGFFTAVEHDGVALNVASLVGLGTTRRCISGPASRRLERDELRAQALLVRAAIDEGALGVSSGLIYEPGRYADLEELVALAAAARDAGAPMYATHLRDEGDALIEAVDEALAVGALAEVAVQFSHHKASGRRNWGKVHRSLEMLDRARTAGRAIACDAYPYVAMWTGLDTILPDDVRDGGTEATLQRLRDPETATAIQLALKVKFEDVDWHAMLVTDAGDGRNAELAGMRMDAIARMWRLSAPLAAMRLLEQERLQVDAAFFTMHEDDVATVLSADFCSIGSDASARGFSGPTAVGVPHPRTFGTFPRVFGRYVRARGTLTLEEAVRRMTSLPARTFGLRSRGTIERGAYADLVLFDPEAIVDRATYEKPYAPPEGIAMVCVNGEPVVRDGVPTPARPGRALRNGGAP